MHYLSKKGYALTLAGCGLASYVLCKSGMLAPGILTGLIAWGSLLLLIEPCQDQYQ